MTTEPEPTDLPDIASREDCDRLVRAFYERAMVDPLIGFLFVDVAKIDLAEHLPVVASFWETILLGEQSYTGGAFHPHANLHAKAELQAGHFDRWLILWCTTVDELFYGPRAALAKVHALRVARAFQRRLAGYASAADASAAGAEGALPLTFHGPAAA